jgi:hypothetical protein
MLLPSMLACDGGWSGVCLWTGSFLAGSGGAASQGGSVRIPAKILRSLICIQIPPTLRAQCELRVCSHRIQRFLSRSYRFQRYHRIMAPNSSCCMCMCACVLYVLCVVVDFVPYICNRVYSECSFFLEELARLKERFRLVSAQIEQVKALQVRPARAGYSLPPSPLPSIPHPSQLIKHCGVCS